MALHIDLYRVDENGRATDIVDKQRFELTGSAKAYISNLGSALRWHKESKDEMWDVISAAVSEYVGTEHEIKNESGKYTRWGVSIEGQFGKDTFDARYKDLVVEELIPQGDRVQINGKDLDGRRVWILLHIGPEGFKIKRSQTQ